MEWELPSFMGPESRGILVAEFRSCIRSGWWMFQGGLIHGYGNDMAIGKKEVADKIVA